MHDFAEKLSHVSMIFIDKDASLAIPLLSGLLKYWPKSNCKKEIDFINELKVIVCKIQLTMDEPYISRVFARISK